MKSHVRTALILGIVAPICLFNSATVRADESGWFRDYFGNLFARLQKLEIATTENTAAIGALTNEVNALKAGGGQTYDYRNYELGRDGTRTYSMQGAGACGTTEVQVLTRAPLNDGSTQVTQARTRRTAGGTVCEYNVFDFRATNDGLYLAGRTGYNLANTAEYNTNVLDALLPQRTTAMRIGATFGSAGGLTSVVYPAGSTTLGAASQTNTLLGIEGVSVPAGNYPNCLKVSETRNSNAIGNLAQVSWYCQGVGLTKRVFTSPTGSPGFKLELLSVE